MYISLITARRWFVAQSQVPNLFYIGKCLTIPIRVYRTKVYREKRVSPANFSLIAIGDLLALIYFDGRVYRCMYTAIGRLFTKERNPPPPHPHLGLFNVEALASLIRANPFRHTKLFPNWFAQQLWQVNDKCLDLLMANISTPIVLNVLSSAETFKLGSGSQMMCEEYYRLFASHVGQICNQTSWYLNRSLDFTLVASNLARFQLTANFPISLKFSQRTRWWGGGSISFYWYINVRRDGWIVANQGL